MQEETRHIHSASGLTLALTVRLPDAPPKGAVLIQTGTCIPQKVYWRFADFLQENGYAAITYDYSGAQDLRSAISHTDWLHDMEAAVDHLLQAFPDGPKIVVGHSSGGQLLGMLPNSRFLDRIYLVASANGYWRLMDGPAKYVMWLFWQLIVPLNLRLFGYFNNRMLGSGGGFPRNIILELRSFCQRPDFFFPFFREQGRLPHYEDIRCPVTAYHLEGDAIASERACRYILDLYRGAERRLITVKAADHGMKRLGHRSFFQTRLQPAWEQLLTDLGKAGQA